jgi:outer membrane immunogenic protein
MKTRAVVALAVVVLLTGAAFAQDKFEVYGEYSYLRFNPTVFGLNSRSFNGGGGGATWYFAKILGIKGDFMGYGSTSFTKTFSSSVTLPNGAVIPAGSYRSQGNMFTYLFGPVVRIPIPKVTPFGEILFGGSNTNGYVNLVNSIDAAGGTISRSPTQHPFTMAIGGGLDISVSTHVSSRPGEIDYVLSRYSNPLASTNNQNNFRYCGGVVFKF